MQAIFSLCGIFTFIVFLGLVLDIIRLPFDLYRNKSIKFDTLHLFAGNHSWKGSLVMVIVFFVGLYGLWASSPASRIEQIKSEEYHEGYNDAMYYATKDYVNCPYCGEEFPDRFAFEIDDSNILCPICAGKDLKAMLNGEILRCYNCDNYYYPSDSNGFGLCYDCCQEYIRECNYCGENTYSWYADEFSLCPRCAGEIFSDKNVNKAVWKYIIG